MIGSIANGLSPVIWTGAQPAAAARPDAAGGNFADVLAGLARGAGESLRSAEQAALGGIAGVLPAQAVVEQVLAAERTLQAVIAIRDKAVGAYLEINRMQI